MGMVALTSVNLTEAVASSVWRTAGAISVVSFVNIAGSAGDRWFASCETNAQAWATWWKFGLSSSGKAFYGVNNGSTGTNVEWGPVNPTTSWHTFGFTRSAHVSGSHTLKFYLDGALSGTATCTMAPNGGSLAVLTIGKDFFASVQAYNQQLHAIALSELSADQMAGLSARIQGAS